MARLRYAYDIDAETLSAADTQQKYRLRMEAIWAHCPDLARVYDEFREGVAQHSQLPPRLSELVRLRIAFHNQCRTCMTIRYQDAVDAGVTEDLVCSLESPADAPDLSDAERAALRLADLFATDHLAVDGWLLDELREHFREKEVLELLFLCARTVGFGRMAAVLAVYDDLPDDPDTTADGRFAPWGLSTR